MRTLIRGSKVLTLDPRQAVIEDGAVLLEDDRIVAVDSFDVLKNSADIQQKLGGDETWLFPGFVNAHYHHDRVFSMGIADLPLELWLLRASGLDFPSPELEAEFNYLNTIVAAIQLVRS